MEYKEVPIGALIENKDIDGWKKPLRGERNLIPTEYIAIRDRYLDREWVIDKGQDY